MIMRKSRSPKIRIVVTVAVVAMMATSACGGGGSAASGGGSAAGKGTLTIGVPDAPANLDPAKDSLGPVYRPLAYEPLINVKPTGGYSPGLATSWRYVGRGNTTFELTLRKNARFSDGTAVTADAVKTWLDYFAEAGGPFVARMGPLKAVKTVGRWTVRLELGAPNPGVVDVIATQNWGAVASPKAVAKPSTLGSKAYGAGPYTLAPSESVTGDHYTYVPNRYYYDKSRIRFSKIVMKVIGNSSSMYQAFQAGQLDVAVGEPGTAAAAERGGVSIVRAPVNTAAFYLTDRNGKLAKPLGDVRVRQALNYAVDRKAITSAIVGTYGKPSAEMPSTDGWDPAYQDHYRYDPAKAKSLLAAAGYPNGFTLKVLDQSGGKDPNGGNALTQATAKYLAAVGVKLEITTATNFGDYLRKIQSKEFPLINQEMPGSYSTNLWYTVVWKQGTLWNFTDANDTVMDKLHEKGAAAPADKGAAYWTQMSRRATEEAHFVPLFVYEDIYYVSDRVGGVTVTAKGRWPYVPDWYPR